MSRRSGKTNSVSDFCDLHQQVYRLLSKRHDVFKVTVPAAFYILCRNPPARFFEIDVLPFCTQQFVCSDNVQIVHPQNVSDF